MTGRGNGAGRREMVVQTTTFQKDGKQPDPPPDPLDMDAVEAEIEIGSKAIDYLNKHAGDDHVAWVAAIKGFRALKTLAVSQSHTSDMQSHAYRQAMSHL